MMCAALPIVIAIAATPGTALAAPGAGQAAIVASSADSGLNAFYGARNFRPLWLSHGAASPAAKRLIAILKRADLDGMNAGPAFAVSAEQALARLGSGRQADLSAAEHLLSIGWVEYVRALKRPTDVGMTYGDMSLAPMTPSGAAILSAAAAAPSLKAHIAAVSNVNPFYSKLRDGYAALRSSPSKVALTGTRDASTAEARLKLNLERTRLLPGSDTGKSIIVDAASQRLWMVDGGKLQGSMRVIVGKASEPTPMIASVVRSVILNPYWNVPVDLVKGRIASNILSQGTGYLATRKYDVLSDWTENARLVDPGTIDWKAVAAGRADVRVRQLPSATNAMGAVKFPFANRYGVYLHDTPDKALFAEANRLLSSGCVRLEDASRLMKWVIGDTPVVPTGRPEQSVKLATPVAVYITYLTAQWDGAKLALLDDPYDRDSSNSNRPAAKSAAAAK